MSWDLVLDMEREEKSKRVLNHLNYLYMSSTYCMSVWYCHAFLSYPVHSVQSSDEGDDLYNNLFDTTNLKKNTHCNQWTDNCCYSSLVQCQLEHSGYLHWNDSSMHLLEEAWMIKTITTLLKFQLDLPKLHRLWERNKCVIWAYTFGLDWLKQLTLPEHAHKLDWDFFLCDLNISISWQGGKDTGKVFMLSQGHLTLWINIQNSLWYHQPIKTAIIHSFMYSYLIFSPKCSPSPLIIT